MSKIIQITIILIILASLSACVTIPSKTKSGVKLVDGRPEWYYNPSAGGKVGGVGVSGIHVNGKTGQKQLAVERALSEIASQLGVKVASYSKVESNSSSAGGSSVKGESLSLFTVDGQTVNASIVEIWEDPRTKELYVWMVAK